MGWSRSPFEDDLVDDQFAGLGGIGSDEAGQPSDDSQAEWSFEDETPVEPWTPAQGFPDPHGVLRVWVDDQDVLTRVRLMPLWRSKLGRVSLTQAFNECFMLLNNYRLISDYAGPQDPSTPDEATHDDEQRAGDEPMAMTAENLTAIEQRMADLQQLGDQLAPDQGWGRWVGEQATGTAAEGKVRCRLTVEGKLLGVEFDPTWLDQANVRAIDNAVVEAHRDARSRFKPPRYQPGERDRLRQAGAQLQAQLDAMLRHGPE